MNDQVEIREDDEVIRPNEPVTFKLSKPISTHKGEVSELVLKPTTASSFIKHGSPYTLNKEQAIVPDWKATFGFLYDMTGHDSVVLGAVPANDTMPLFYKLVGMLNARPQNG